MNIAISSTGTNLYSAVDPRFGRADYLIIADTESIEIVHIIDNLAAKDAAHGAGINAASRIAEAGVKVLLTGRVGPKAAAVCEKAGITIINDVSGSVFEAITNFHSSSTSNSQCLPIESLTTMPADQNRGRGQGLGRRGGRGCGKNR